MPGEPSQDPRNRQKTGGMDQDLPKSNMVAGLGFKVNGLGLGEFGVWGFRGGDRDLGVGACGLVPEGSKEQGSH